MGRRVPAAGTGRGAGGGLPAAAAGEKLFSAAETGEVPLPAREGGPISARQEEVAISAIEKGLPITGETRTAGQEKEGGGGKGRRRRERGELRLSRTGGVQRERGEGAENGAKAEMGGMSAASVVGRNVGGKR